MNKKLINVKFWSLEGKGTLKGCKFHYNWHKILLSRISATRVNE